MSRFMRRARRAILAQGGVTRCNTFTKLYLSMFGQYDWHGCADHSAGDDPAAELVLLQYLQYVLVVARHSGAAGGHERQPSRIGPSRITPTSTNCLSAGATASAWG